MVPLACHAIGEDALGAGPLPTPHLYTPLIALTLVAFLASCSSEQAAPTPEGWLSATILGDAPATYRGTGYFESIGGPPGLPLEMPRFFHLYSAGTGASSGAEFVLTGNRSERPEVGRYPLGKAQGTAIDWYLSYTMERGDSLAFFAAIDGEFEITASSDAAIAGRFSFTAIGGPVCSKDWSDRELDENGVPLLPCTFSTDAEPPTIEVNGSFNVVHGILCEPFPGDGTSTTEMPKPVVRFCVN